MANEITPSRGEGREKNIVRATAEKFGGLIKLVRSRAALDERVERMWPITIWCRNAEAKARDRLAELPPVAELRADEATLQAAINVPATEKEIRWIVGLMLEGFGQRANTTATNIDWIVEELLLADADEEKPVHNGFSAAVLFLATLRIGRDSKFVPTASEIVEKVREVRRETAKALRVTRAMIEASENATSIADFFAVPEGDDGGPLELDDNIPF